jgi:hypothetical protein
MNPIARTVLATAAASIALAAGATTAHAGFGVEERNFEAGTCVNFTCTYKSVEANHAEAFTQAAGHPPWGITTFELNHRKGLLGEEPEGAIRRVRVDIPPGLAANPEAPGKCAPATFQAGGCKSAAKAGTTEMVVYDGTNDLPISGTVYNLQQPPGLPLDFGIEVAPLKPLVNAVRLYLEGHVAWWSDYHEYFEINNIPKEAELSGGIKAPLTVLKSKLNFEGRAGGNFLTLPSQCSSSTTSHIEVESWAGEVSRADTHTPVGVEGCNRVPFAPGAAVRPAVSQSDTPDGASVEVSAHQNAGGEEINTADIRDARVTLPEGLTLNPSAAAGLATCSPAQIGIGTTNPVSCPPASRVGSVLIETDLPPHSLAGAVYLGNPGGGPITGPPFTAYIDAESVYGVSVRLKGLVNANPASGRLEASFSENPQLPFSQLIVTLNGGPRAPLANPLACGASALDALFTPYTGLAAAHSSSPFTTTGCPSPLPFSWGQSAGTLPGNAGAFGATRFGFNLGRNDGQQYLAHVATALPPGLVGEIPAVPLCGEPQAAQGTCSAASQIGTATVAVGAGSEPYSFSGPVFLTGPYGGAPFGLSIPVRAVAGPFDFGTVVTRVTIGVDPYSARVVATSTLPTIVGGVPLRLKTVNVSVNRSNFLLNPTNCGRLATDSSLTSTFGAAQNVSSPFGVTGCSALAFKPSFRASTAAKATKLNGTSLQVNVTQPPHEANFHSVVTKLPVQLPARLTTLQQACPEATYAANPFSCPAGSNVGSATVTTAVLPGKLGGPAILVSHGGAGFPDLDLVLEGSGVRVILVGNTDIKGGVTTSTFASLPDVPLTSFSLSLPAGPHSALTGYGNLCAQPLLMPTVITAQNGAQIRQDTRIAVPGCVLSSKSANRCIKVLKRKLAHHALMLKVRVCAAGRLSARGKYLRGASRKLRKAGATTLKLSLTGAGVHAMRRHSPLKIRVALTFVPQRRGGARAYASTTVAFRR